MAKKKVETEKETKNFEVLGKETSQRIKLNMIGEQIEVSFKSNTSEQTYISCPQISISIGG